MCDMDPEEQVEYFAWVEAERVRSTAPRMMTSGLVGQFLREPVVLASAAT